MSRPITVSRATIGSGISEPVQCSENMQLAINSTNHITIVEPKLPLLHQCLSNVGESSSAAPDPSVYFDVRSVFHIETKDSLGFQIFSRILIEDSETMFGFSRISEPIIVGHAWSPVEPSTRDCYLGVLLNTGEVLVLKRATLDASSYEVQFRSFPCILDQMAVPSKRLTIEGDIILTGAQFSELKVTSFSFGKTLDGALVISLAHESGDITIHALVEGLPLLQRLKTSGLVVKSLWSSSCNEFYFVLNDNSVWGYKLGSAMSIEDGPVRVKGPSRFIVSHLHHHAASNNVIVTDSKSIHYGSLGSQFVSANLPFHATIVNVSVIENASTITVLLPYESGHLCLANIDPASKSIEIVQDPSGWEAFCHLTLHRYQALLAKEQVKASSKPFQPYLAETVEGQITVHGCVPMPANDMLAVVYSLTPTNTITHTIKSRREFKIGLLSSRNWIPAGKKHDLFGASALTYLSSLILRDRNEIPRADKDVRDGKSEALNTYVAKLKDWKLARFTDPLAMELTVTPKASLEESIISNFSRSTAVDSLQKHFLVNIALQKTFRAIRTNNEKAFETLDQELVAIAREQDIISSKIRTQLASIVVLWASEQSITSFDSTLDTFLLNTYRVVLLHSNMALAELPIPESVKLTISTDVCTEMFEISKEQVLSSLKTVMSSSKHSWPRCDMTLLPILDLSNKSDELESHNYLSAKRDESHILNALFSCLNYCIYTGTRTFDLKVGV
ncbi:hypothetical protein OXX80_007869 [Metschnikowia pulcherrima]